MKTPHKARYEYYWEQRRKRLAQAMKTDPKAVEKYDKFQRDRRKEVKGNGKVDS